MRYVSNSVTRLFFSFVRYQQLPITIFTILCILAGAIPAVDSILLQKIIDIIESFTDNSIAPLLSRMFFWAVGYALWWQGVNILWRLYDYTYLKFMPLIKGKIIEELYNYTQYHHHKFFQDNLAGHITNRITEGANAFEMIFAILTEKILRKLSIIIFALVTMYVVHHMFATIFLIWLTAFIAISIFFSSTINQYSATYASNRSLVVGKIVDSVANINTIKMFTSYRFERAYLKHYIDNLVKSDQNIQWFMFKLRYVLGLSLSIMIFSIIYYISRLRSELMITIGDCVLIITLCLAVVNEVWDLTQEIGDIFEEIGIFKQSMSLIAPYMIKDINKAEQLLVSVGTIEFKNVTFYYRNNTNLFEGTSVTILGKQKVGLAGFSGSGKTTFVNLILRLHDLKQGQILIDGQNIKSVTQDSLRANISIIPQEPTLFHRTIIENIRYGKQNATDAEVIKAAKLAYIHDFIANLPEGYNTLCGERGNNLSGGQKQRIVIARAILKNAPILILDEATSSLDITTERLIQKSLNYLMQNKTVIVIAHRLPTLLNMDRILVFDSGSIVEDGTHSELLTKSKLYKKLWTSQTTGLIACTAKVT